MSNEKKVPPPLAKETIEEVCKSRGFHRGTLTKPDADAIMRGEKTALAMPASLHVQKGDWFVCSVYEDIHSLVTCFHDLDHLVFEATHVSDINGSDPRLSLVCFRKKDGYRFHSGDIHGTFKDDTITH